MKWKYQGSPVITNLSKGKSDSSVGLQAFIFDESSFPETKKSMSKNPIEDKYDYTRKISFKSTPLLDTQDYSLIFDRFHFFSDMNPFLNFYGAKRIISQCGLSTMMNKRKGDLSHICDIAVYFYGLEAELYQESSSDLTNLISLQGKLTVKQYESFLNLFQSEVKSSVIGKDYYFDTQSALNHDGEVIDLRRFIKQRSTIVKLSSKNDFTVKFLSEYSQSQGLNVSSSDNLVYGLEEIKEKDEKTYENIRSILIGK